MGIVDIFLQALSIMTAYKTGLFLFNLTVICVRSVMKDSIVSRIKVRNQVQKSSQEAEKRIRYLQRELVRASFMGHEKQGLCRKLLKLIQQERTKIHPTDHNTVSQ